MTPTSVGMRCPECARQRTRVVNARNLYSGQPTVTYALIVINVAVFLAELVSGVSLLGNSFGGSKIILHGALFGPSVANGDWWRLVTSGFLHFNLWHIAFNMYALYILGTLLEPAIGHAKFALIYFVSLLAGSFGALIVSPHSITVGASGAVFGLFGAAILEMRSRGVDVMQTGLPLWLGINLVFSFTFNGISIGGHIGGLIGGALAGVAVAELDKRRGLPGITGSLVAAAVGIVAVIGAIAVAHSST
jgi:membrane associated rhomboid family serine protease